MASINSTLSTRGSYFVNHTSLLRKTGPGWECHVGKDVRLMYTFKLFHIKHPFMLCTVGRCGDKISNQMKGIW